MTKEKVGTKYYATDEPSGTPITEDIKLDNRIYILVTASLSGGETKYTCTYKYKVTATLNNPMIDGTGGTYLTNTEYVSSGWSDKITNWKWPAVNTLTSESGGSHYYTGSDMTPTNIYLNEMNRNSKTSSMGEWAFPSGKVGLMYVSDY